MNLRRREITPGGGQYLNKNKYIGAQVLDVFSMIRDEDEACEMNLIRKNPKKNKKMHTRIGCFR